MERILIAGCGFVGTEAARLFHRAGWAVSALTHSEPSAAALSSEPYPVFACDITSQDALVESRERIGPVDAVIHCASSSRGGAEEYRRIYVDGAENLWRVFSPGRFLFTGSTSVYAQADGSWVDEESPAEPERATGRMLRTAEQFVLERGGTVARLAGLYGPGRSVLLRRFLEGSAVIEGNGERWLNQIHRDDAAAALFLLLARSQGLGGIFNVADDTPLTQLECHQWLAERFVKAMPPKRPPDLERKRGWTSKRVSNRKLRGLGWRCAYPSFTEAVLKDSRLAGEEA